MTGPKLSSSVSLRNKAALTLLSYSPDASGFDFSCLEIILIIASCPIDTNFQNNQRQEQTQQHNLLTLFG